MAPVRVIVPLPVFVKPPVPVLLMTPENAVDVLLPPAMSTGVPAPSVTEPAPASEPIVSVKPPRSSVPGAAMVTAVVFGRRGEMDVALGIAWESSKQIALFVAPVLVFAGVLLSAPLDLAFRPMETLSVGVAVISTALIATDGETHWLEGAFLLAVYAVLALGFWFVA